MSSITHADSILVGIDVSKQTLDVGLWPSRQGWRTGQAPEEVSELADHIAGLQPVLVVLEATGGLEWPIIEALVERQVPVHRCEPKRARHFARSLGLLAKTDRIDKFALARFGATGELAPQQFASKLSRQLDALTTRRRQLVEQITQEKNRLKATSEPTARASIQRHLQWLDSERKALEAEIQAAVSACEHTRIKIERLTSVPGVGLTTAAVLLGTLPEFGTLSRREVAALAGTAPFNDDSGKHRGRRRIRAGRKDVRCALYMATLVATRFNPVIRHKYASLLTKGKEKKVALTACMRKLIVILNALLRDESCWRPTAPAA